MKKRIINGILILILVISIGTAGCLIYDYYKDQKSSTYIEVQPPKEIKKEEKEVITKKQYVNELPNYRTQYNNEFIKGRLRIPNIQLDLLVTRSDDNNFFLEHNLYKEYDGIGTAMFDFRNTDLLTNKQINIYGHNTENKNIYDKVPFVKLEAYTDANVFNTAQDIYLDIDEKEMHYKLISIKISEKTNDEHMKMDFENDDDFENHVKELMSGSLYTNNNIQITKNDRILIIQTCHYNPYDTFLILIAKEIYE